MYLFDTNDSIEVLLGGAHTVTAPVFYSTYLNYDSVAGTFVMDRQSGVFNGSTPVDAVDAPAANTQRQLKYLNIFNADTVPNTVTIQLNQNSTIRKLCTIEIRAGEVLTWLQETGWRVGNVPEVLNQDEEVPIRTPLSGAGAGNTLINIDATATAGTVIHANGTNKDTLWLWAVNTAANTVSLTLEYMGVTDPDDLIKTDVPKNSGLILIIPGLLLDRNSQTIAAFASSADKINIVGYVERLSHNDFAS